MYTRNVKLNAAQECFGHATSDNLSVSAPSQYLSASARSYDAWQYLPQGLLSLPREPHFTAELSSSPLPKKYGLSSVVPPHGGYPSGAWRVDGRLPQSPDQIPPYHPTKPPAHNLQRPLQACVDCLECTEAGSGHPHSDQHFVNQRISVPNGLPLSPEDFLPHSSAYLASKAESNMPNASISNVDGTGRNNEDRRYDERRWSEPFYQTQLSEHSVRYGKSPAQPQYYRIAPVPAGQSRRPSSTAFSPTLADNHGQSNNLPVWQEWRTDNLTSELCPETPHLAKHSYSIEIGPWKASHKIPDAATRRKQEKYRQKGEARRNTLATASPQTFAHRVLAPSDHFKPQPAHAPPAKRRRVTTVAALEVCRSSQHKPAVTIDPNPYDDDGHNRPTLDNLHPQNPAYRPPAVELAPPIADEMPQAIVGRHEEYKWSVFHYQLQPKGYDFAQRWVEELFHTTLSAEYDARHVTHVSRGFIQDGDRYSIIVLHNAANPFEYEPTPTSTVTIGVYGYYWYQHSEIHWTTLATDQRHLFVQCIQNGWLVEKYKWTQDAKPTEKRFHRAYWLAANRLDLRGLLNRGPSDDKPHDAVDEAVEIPEEDFCISEHDLTNEWEVTDDAAGAIWRKVQDEIADLGEDSDLRGAGFQHALINNSEW